MCDSVFRCDDGTLVPCVRKGPHTGLPGKVQEAHWSPPWERLWRVWNNDLAEPPLHIEPPWHGVYRPF